MWVGGMGGWGGYDQLCCPASPKLLLGLDLGLGCDKIIKFGENLYFKSDRNSSNDGTFLIKGIGWKFTSVMKINHFDENLSL